MNSRTRFAPIVEVGSTVHLRDLQTKEVEAYTLTAPGDANIRHNRISTLTPIGHAIYGRGAGEIIEFDAPGGTIAIEIVEVEPMPPPSSARDG
ncbi:GreA/GreB family elongation factor [Aeoliella sp. SH292]|uniref:GreA/GreB family elongation factor n=1 Tax=Aeoliella sp. SH292 TaxID=3454464 RepID=UPI003F9B2B8D